MLYSENNIFICTWKTEIKKIKYNKKLQKYINISIINYKHFTGKYIKYKSNGIGEEYDSKNGDIIIYEGEFLNGERKGKGKEYINIWRWIYKRKNKWKRKRIL